MKNQTVPIVFFAVSTLTLSGQAQSSTPVNQISAASIHLKQLKQAGWNNWPAIKELIELGEAEVLQTVITQLRLPDQEWVEDAVEALCLVSQPRLIGLLINDVIAEPAPLAEGEPEDLENQPAPLPASKVIIAQFSKIVVVPPNVKTWLGSTAQLQGDAMVTAMREFLEFNRRCIGAAKFNELKRPGTAEE